MRVTQKRLDKSLRELNHIIKVYKKKYSKDDKRDWRTYEQRLGRRMRTAAKELRPIIKEAYSMIKITKKDNRGPPPKVNTEQKVMILLLKTIFQLSNRKMANFLFFFTLLTGIDVSYKTVERTYSDPLVQMVIHNMFVIMVKRKGITDIDLSGDGTGYSLTITKHYRRERTKELKKKSKKKKKKKSKTKGKKKSKKNKKMFVRSVALLDLDTKMYVGYGTSMKSEKEAFDEAYKMMEEMGITVNSVRLDKYYSNRKIVKKFGKNVKIYLIPKSNSTIRGSPEWKRMIDSFIEAIFLYLGEYYKRNNSESEIGVDKKMCGWKIWQRRTDRIHSSSMARGVWHNLFRLG